MLLKCSVKICESLNWFIGTEKWKRVMTVSVGYPDTRIPGIALISILVASGYTTISYNNASSVNTILISCSGNIYSHFGKFQDFDLIQGPANGGRRQKPRPALGILRPPLAKFFSDNHSFSFHRLSIKDDRCCLYQ